MDFLTKTYAALSASQPQQQTLQATIDILTDRLLQSTELADRRSSLLALRNISRDAKREVGESALMGLLGVLGTDAEQDGESAKAVLETLVGLCERDVEPDGRPKREDLGMRHTDVVLSSPEPVHTLVLLLAQTTFYTRFTTLQLLAVLLQNRPTLVQDYVLTSPQGVGALVAVLQERREVIRNEALLLLQNLIASNADLQKIVAFEGAFERLLDIAAQEGGIEGGVVAQDCLTTIDALLRFNVSNQNYFRETSNIPRLAPLLLFPSPPPGPNDTSPQAFALQFWDEQKLLNAQLVVKLVALLVGGVGSGKQANQMALLATGMTRCLIELSLASNSPTSLKSLALNALSTLLTHHPTQAIFSELRLTPFAWAGGDEWDRLPEQTAVGCLVRMALEGDWGAAVRHGGAEVGQEGLEVRSEASRCFESYVQGNVKAHDELLGSMVLPAAPVDTSLFADPPQPASVVLLSALIALPSPTQIRQSTNGLPLARFNTYSTLFASHLFSHILRAGGEDTKEKACKVVMPTPSNGGGEGEEEDAPPTLVQVLIGNVTLSFREHARARAEGLHKEAREWDRACVGWLSVLCTWLWESPGTVREFLTEGSNIQVLVAPIVQASGVDPLVQGLAAFLLGTCYEFNTAPGEITRATLHPILHSRVGADQFVNRMTRLREDERFKAITPESMVVAGHVHATHSSHPGPPSGPTLDGEAHSEETEVWFDWAFVEFWKNTYFSVQRAITSDPNAGPSAGESPQTLALISSLRDVINSQAHDLEAMRQKLETLIKEREEERDIMSKEIERLNGQVAELSMELSDTYTARKEQDMILHTRDEQIDELTGQIAQLTSEAAARSVQGHSASLTEVDDYKVQVEALQAALDTSRSKAKDQEKEQEDLLVLLDEMSEKRKRDKAKLKEAGIAVSDAEDEGDVDDDDID